MAVTRQWNWRQSAFRALVWASLGAVALWLVALLANVGLPPRFSVVMLGIMGVGVPSALYLVRGVSYEKAVVLMVLTLPLLYGFVIDIGGNLRITYLFAIMAFGLGLWQGKLRTFPKEPALVFLAAFVAYAVLSTALTFGVDTSGSREAAGFRLSSLRSVIQAGQLLLMVLAFYVTINYVTSPDRLRRFSNLVFWSTAAVVLYGTYDFLAALFDLPFFSIIYDLSYYAGGSDSPSFTMGGVSIPRPRSSLAEPLDLSIFLLFGISYSIASLTMDKSSALRALKIGLIFLGCLLFLVANSRSSLLAMPVILALVLWLAPSHAIRLKMVLSAAVVYLLVAFVLFPAASGKVDPFFPVQYYQERMSSLKNIGANLQGEPEGASIGRGYSQPLAVFRDHPIFGVGLGNYPYYYSQQIDSPTVVLATTFSLYFRLLTELGIIGTSLFLLFVGSTLWGLLRAIKRTSDPSIRPFVVATLVAIVGVMIARVGLDGLYTDSYMWVMLGVGVAIPWLVGRGEASSGTVQHPNEYPKKPVALSQPR